MPARSRSAPTAALVAVALVATVLGGCATRAVPERFPQSSPASPSAAEVPRPADAVALREDPPPPGESTADWKGLAPAEKKPGSEHDHHQHHHHHHHAPAAPAEPAEPAGAAPSRTPPAEPPPPDAKPSGAKDPHHGH